MTNDLSTTKMKDVIWEEKNLIAPPMKSENNAAFGAIGSMPEIKYDFVKSECGPIGKISGIYKIINKVNGKYYVGSSDNIRRRWRTHKNKLMKKTHPNLHLQSAWHKYGENNFHFLIIEKIPVENLKEIEQKYLNICRFCPDTSYNIAYEIEHTTRGIKYTDERRKQMSLISMGRIHTTSTKEKIRIAKLGNLNPNFGKRPSLSTIEKHNLKVNKPIYQVDKYGNVIDEFPSIKDAAEKLNVERGAISRVCSGVYKHTKGLFFKYREFISKHCHTYGTG